MDFVDILQITIGVVLADMIFHGDLPLLRKLVQYARRVHIHMVTVRRLRRLREDVRQLELRERGQH